MVESRGSISRARRHAGTWIGRAGWIVLLAGCASVDPRPDYERARQMIGSSTGQGEVHAPDGPALEAHEIEAVLADGLGLDEALRLALLNNRRLQAQFMTLGVARAELVQAGLLSNPAVSLLFLLPSGGGRTNLQASIAQSISDLWRIPARKRVAQAGLELRLLEVSRFAAELVADTRRAYYESVAARDAVAVARESLDIAARGLAAERVRVREGVATTVEEHLARGLALSAELALRRAEQDETGAKRRLAALLSLSSELGELELVDPLPRPSSPALAREDLVESALRARLDLRAFDAAIRTAQEQVALERGRALPDASVSLAVERPEGNGKTLVGPGTSLSLPVFDQNQAGISRAQHRSLELERLREALASEIAQELRASLDRALLAASAAAFVRDELLPHAERSASLARRAYELGTLTQPALLEAERSLLLARREHLDARLQAALAWNELERSAGAPIPRQD